MSSYATPADFFRFGIRAAALPATVTPEDIQAAVDAASALADGYLGARFRLPIEKWGDDLRQAVCALAAFDLISCQVGFNPEAGHNMVLLTRKQEMIRWLEHVSQGHITPVGVGETAPPAAFVPRVYSNPPRGW